MKILPSLFLAGAILAGIVTPAKSQLNLYVGPSNAEALGGQWGGDVRLGYNLIALPLEVFFGGDLFPGNCGKSCGLWGWRLGGDLRSPATGVVPFVSGAWVHRNWDLGTESLEKEGVAVGIGLSLEFGFRVRAEAFHEFLGGELDQFVLRVALGL